MCTCMRNEKWDYDSLVTTVAVFQRELVAMVFRLAGALTATPSIKPSVASELWESTNLTKCKHESSSHARMSPSLHDPYMNPPNLHEVHEVLHGPLWDRILCDTSWCHYVIVMWCGLEMLPRRWWPAQNKVCDAVRRIRYRIWWSRLCSSSYNNILIIKRTSASSTWKLKS